jgi:hypothetical protein
MKDLLTFVVTQIVDQPEAVSVDETTDPEGTLVLTLHVADDDMGKVIGRSGKIIRALRLLLKVKAIRTNQHVRLELAEPEVPVSPE